MALNEPLFFLAISHVRLKKRKMGIPSKSLRNIEITIANYAIAILDMYLFEPEMGSFSSV